MKQEVSIGRSVHVRTEGGCIPGVVAGVGMVPDDRIEITIFPPRQAPVPLPTFTAHGPTTGWHWHFECPDAPPKKVAE